MRNAHGVDRKVWRLSKTVLTCRSPSTVRVTTAFNRLLDLPGVSVTDVSFGEDRVIVDIALTRRRRPCECFSRGSARSRSAGYRPGAPGAR
jgi:hypothetical protein